MPFIYEKHIINDQPDGEELYINSCGYLNFCDDASTVRIKGSGDFQLLYIAEGKGYFMLGQGETEVFAGSFLYFTMDMPQIYHYKKEDNAKVYFCHFAGNGAQTLLSESGLEPAKVYCVKSKDSVISGFERIIKEYIFKEVLYNKIAQGQIAEILASVSRSVPENSKLAGSRINPAIVDINKRCEQNRSIDDYAKMCNLSKYHFLRLFKKHTGLSPIAYRNKLRISLAAEYLSTTSLSVSEISYFLGFSSPSYFCRLYKKHTGKTATEQMQNDL